MSSARKEKSTTKAYVVIPRPADDSKEEKEESARVLTLPMLKGLGKTKGMRFETTLAYGTQIAVNSSAGKYEQFISGATAFQWGSLVAGLAEFSSLDALFDEFFIRSVKLQYIPRNHFSAQSTASSSASGSPGDLNTCGATFVWLPHNGALYADSAAAWYNAAVAQHHKIVDMGNRVNWTVKNPTKFSWTLPIGDQSTSLSNMGWCQFSLASAKYGGAYQLITPVASGASVGIGTLLENGIFGDVMFHVHLACRARA